MASKKTHPPFAGRRAGAAPGRLALALVAAHGILGAPAGCDLAGTPPEDDAGVGPPLVFPCGELGVLCTIGFVCVISDVSVSRQQPQLLFECRGDPCRPEELTCLCASTLCGPGQACIREDERTIRCREE